MKHLDIRGKVYSREGYQRKIQTVVRRVRGGDLEPDGVGISRGGFCVPPRGRLQHL